MAEFFGKQNFQEWKKDPFDCLGLVNFSVGLDKDVMALGTLLINVWAPLVIRVQSSAEIIFFFLQAQHFPFTSP